LTTPAEHWDRSYAMDDYKYGKLPNEFLRDQVGACPAGGRLLCLGEGEGRNATFLAAQGFEVVAVDASAVGLAKADKLAKERGVRITTLVADLDAFSLGRDAWDAVVSIWCHLPPALRARVHRELPLALRPRGVLLLEAYTPAQLRFNTGGPQSADLLPTLAELRVELAGLEFEVAVERERDVHEGQAHRGRSAVVQIIARRRPERTAASTKCRDEVTPGASGGGETDRPHQS
jgi:SAM-dependent methyltransferase